jgi:hypothetical protein
LFLEIKSAHLADKDISAQEDREIIKRKSHQIKYLFLQQQKKYYIQ